MSAQQIAGRHYESGSPIRVHWGSESITSIESSSETAARGRWLAPGLLDLQINGFGGIDFQQDDVSLDGLTEAVEGLTRAGCSRILLTLITDSWPRLLKRLKHYRGMREKSERLRRSILGWHIEGPFLSQEPGFHGAHDPQHMRDPSPHDIDELKAIVHDDPLLITLAPERHGSLETIHSAVRHGVTVSLGHTNASATRLKEAVNAGATGFTHLGNGCPKELDRSDNILWRVWDTPGLTVSLIPDQIHLSPPLFRAMHRLLPPERLYYTTDAMAAAGAQPGRFTLGKLDLEVGNDRIVRAPGSRNLAGSALQPIQGVFRAARMLGTPWHQIWKRMLEVPARFLGVPPQQLAAGEPPDFYCLEENEAGEIATLVTPVGERLSLESTWSP